MKKTKLSESERKALLQLSRNNAFSSVALNSKRAMALARRLHDRGLIELDDEDYPIGATVTDAGAVAIARKVETTKIPCPVAGCSNSLLHVTPAWGEEPFHYCEEHGATEVTP
jgi:hypothetical protein